MLNSYFLYVITDFCVSFLIVIFHKLFFFIKMLLTEDIKYGIIFIS